VLLEGERAAIARYARRLRPDNLVVGTAGNLSVRRGDMVAITPAGLDYDELTPASIGVVDMDGRSLETQVAPSTELPMHLAAYRHGSAGAVVHAHPPYATTLSTSIGELPSIHYLIATLGGPIRVAPYAAPGSEELGENMVRCLEGRSAVLLANHGTVTIGASLEEAYSRSLTLEWLAALYFRARLLGDPKLLSVQEIERVAETMRKYGAPPP
jgi:L-fuculose-phosphate aldolase